MNKGIEAVFEDLDNLYLPEYLDAALKKIGNISLKQGSRIYWYYEEDKKFHEEQGCSPKDWDCFSGILIASPDTTMRSPDQELEFDNCIVCMDTYPIEKEYCEATWIALNKLLDAADLVEVYVKENK